MNSVWATYDELVRAKNVLGDAPRYARPENLNDAIDEAFRILDNNLPQLAVALEELEEESE